MPGLGGDIAGTDIEVSPLLPQLLDRMTAVAEARYDFLAAAGLVFLEHRIDRFDDDRQRDAVLKPLLHQGPILGVEDERRVAAKGKVGLDFLEVRFGRGLVGHMGNVPCATALQSPLPGRHSVYYGT